MALNSKKYIVLSFILTIIFSLYGNNYSFSPLKSAILPGWGQISTGNKAGYAHLGLELAFISSLIYFSNEADIKNEQSINYAIEFAHIKSKNNSDAYFKMIGRYNSSYFEAGGYNQEVLNSAIAMYPGDPVAQQSYIEENSIPEEQNWRWDDKNNRYRYNDLRQKYFLNQDYAKIATGIIVANHMFSFFDMLIRYKNRNIADRYTIYSSMNNDLTPMLNIQLHF